MRVGGDFRSEVGNSFHNLGDFRSEFHDSFMIVAAKFVEIWQTSAISVARFEEITNRCFFSAAWSKSRAQVVSPRTTNQATAHQPRVGASPGTHARVQGQLQ